MNVFKHRKFYSFEFFAVQSMSRQSCYVYVQGLCILADTELTCLLERPCKQCLQEGIYHPCLFYFQCSTINSYKYEGKHLLRRIPHASHGRFTPFAISIANKEAHIINENIAVAFRCVTFSSRTSDPPRRINTFVNVLIITLIQFLSHTKELPVI